MFFFPHDDEREREKARERERERERASLKEAALSPAQ
jgi:hypothetical protein